jgi:hypothetical protein
MEFLAVDLIFYSWGNRLSGLWKIISCCPGHSETHSMLILLEHHRVLNIESRQYFWWNLALGILVVSSTSFFQFLARKSAPGQFYYRVLESHNFWHLRCPLFVWSRSSLPKLIWELTHRTLLCNPADCARFILGFPCFMMSASIKLMRSLNSNLTNWQFSSSLYSLS